MQTLLLSDSHMDMEALGSNHHPRCNWDQDEPAPQKGLSKDCPVPHLSGAMLNHNAEMSAKDQKLQLAGPAS